MAMNAESMAAVCAVLRHRQQEILADLLDHTSVEFHESSTYGSYLFSFLTTAEIYAPIDAYDQLQGLLSTDHDLILSAMHEIWPPRPYDIEINHIEFRLDATSLKSEPGSKDSLIQCLNTLSGS